MHLPPLHRNLLLLAACALGASFTAPAPALGQTNGAAATPSTTAPPTTDTATPMATPPAPPSDQMTTPPAGNETQSMKPPMATNAPPMSSTTVPAEPMERPTTYTVVSGDTLWGIAQKFDTSVKKLKRLNGLKKNALKPGQSLKIPPLKTTTAHAAKKMLADNQIVATADRPARNLTAGESTETHLRAQPLQDVDEIAAAPASTTADSSLGNVGATPAPRLSAASSPAKSGATLRQPDLAKPTPLAPAKQVATAIKKKRVSPSLADTPPPAATISTMGKAQSSLASTKVEPSSWFHWKSNDDDSDWGAKFLTQAQNLADLNINYDGTWRPPGEDKSWVMDCSNTTRYLYRATTGLELPRTASDQYYYLHLQNRAWDVPQTSSGFADLNYLRENLRPGDLLFWEYTYRPERQPPITHVMVFLGQNQQGNWIMAGSQTGRGGEHNRRHGGPDIYLFDPLKPTGGYSTWLGLVHHHGRFCAYGRPLAADAKRLSVAAD